MPLRDHFRPPLERRRRWESFHASWPTVIVARLSAILPPRYFAEPRTRLGVMAEIDIATFNEGADATVAGGATGDGADGAVATAVWSPPRPTLTLVTDLPAPAAYEVRVFDEERGGRLVAAVEIVSPANKDRPEHRRAFVAKCAALLQEQVSVTIVDLVTTRQSNLYGDLLALIGGDEADPSLSPEPPPLYATACRGTRKDLDWLLETWVHALAISQQLPTLPLWLADDLAVPLDLESSYEETCHILRIA